MMPLLGVPSNQKSALSPAPNFRKAGAHALLSRLADTAGFFALRLETQENTRKADPAPPSLK